jgi:hypothetical protein
MASVQAALDSARDKAALAGALEAKAWTLLFAGSRDEALKAFNEYASVGMPFSPGRAVLEFRLAASDQMDAARRLAETAFARPDLGERAALAIKVMLGEKDMRDVAIDSPEAATEYATYLAGYRLEPATPSGGSAKPGADPTQTAATFPIGTAQLPVIVISAPESVGADDATVAVARLACRDALAKRGRFRVVDTDSRKAAIDELELSLSGATAGDKDKAVGSLFSADFVASGSVIRADSGWLVAYTLSGADDGHIVASDFAVASDHAAIIAAAGRFAGMLDGLSVPEAR